MFSVPRNVSQLDFVRELLAVKTSKFGSILLVLLAIGALTTTLSCNSKKSTDSEIQLAGSTTDDDALTPEGKLHDQLSSGSFQAEASVSSITIAFGTAESLSSTLKQGEAGVAISDVQEVLNICGKAMAELIDESPPEAEIKESFGKFDDQRIKAIEVANDCLHDLDEANGILDSLKTELTGDAQGNLTLLQSQIAEAMDDVIGTIEGFGGKVEPVG